MLSFGTILANTLLTQIKLHIDANVTAEGEPGDGGKIHFYSGPVPADIDAPLAGSNLELGKQYPDVPCGIVANKVLEFKPFTKASTADRQGECTFFRLTDSLNNPWIQGTVSLPAGNGDMKLTETTFVPGAPITVVSLKIRVG